jgi:hypothetical protein
MMMMMYSRQQLAQRGTFIYIYVCMCIYMPGEENKEFVALQKHSMDVPVECECVLLYVVASSSS